MKTLTLVLAVLGSIASAHAEIKDITAATPNSHAPGFVLKVEHQADQVLVTLTPGGGNPQGISRFLLGSEGLPYLAGDRLEKLEIKIPASLCTFAESGIAVCVNNKTKGHADQPRVRMILTADQSVRELDDSKEDSLILELTLQEITHRQLTFKPVGVAESTRLKPSMSFWISLDDANSGWISFAPSEVPYVPAR